VTAPAPPAIEVTDLTVRYGPVLALDRVTFQVRPGRVCGVIGMNGSGKSTLFKSIMGLVRLEAGQVLVDGRPPVQARRAGMVAYVPQSEDVDWSFPLSVGEVVMMGRYGQLGWTRRPRRTDREAVAAALAQVELTELAGRQIGALSGGQRKRAFVARGIAQGAQVLLLDEPFAGVDKRSELTIVTLLRQLAAEGRTVVTSTHDLRGLPDLCDEAILLQQRLLLQGSPAMMLEPGNLALAFGLDLRGQTGSSRV
jgi:manganese transport system ATP-binding protein